MIYNISLSPPTSPHMEPYPLLNLPQTVPLRPHFSSTRCSHPSLLQTCLSPEPFPPPPACTFPIYFPLIYLPSYTCHTHTPDLSSVDHMSQHTPPAEWLNQDYTPCLSQTHNGHPTRRSLDCLTSPLVKTTLLLPSPHHVACRLTSTYY